MYEYLVERLREAKKYAEISLENPYIFSAYYGAAADAIEQLQNNIDEKCKEWLKVKGKCPTCARCSDNREHTTTCPIEEHYALPLDGYCHLYEEKK